jgi:hypothetical protein
MVSRILMASLGAIMLTVVGCNLGPPQVLAPTSEGSPEGTPEPELRATAPPPALTARQIQGVLECQEAIKREGAEFTRFKEKNLNECLDEVLELQLPFENGQIDSDHYNRELSEIRGDCARQFNQIGQASTKLVNGIVDVCGPVQSLILPYSGYDPLQFGALTRSLGNALVSDATTLAGRICGAKELFVDASVAVQEPRLVGLLEILDNGTGQFATSGPPSRLLGLTSTIPNIPLDARCIYPSLP